MRRWCRRNWWLLLIPLLAAGWYAWQRLRPHSTIVWVSDRGGCWAIYRMNDDGSGVRRLIKLPADYFEHSLAMSPNGRHIAYVQDTPAGIDVYSQIWVADITGANPQQVTAGGKEDWDPAFFPDGRSLIYTSGRHDTKTYQWENDLCLINLNGTAKRQLTSGASDDRAPLVSPDGRYIVFLSYPSHSDEWYQYRINVDGTGLRRLTTHLAGPIFNPVISPDSKWIAFTSDSHDIYRINADGNGLMRLTTTSAMELDPAISSDGQWIAFASYDGGRGRIYLMDAHGGHVRRLAQETGETREPTFSPDGKWIAYTVDDQALHYRDIFVTNINGRGRKMLTNNWLRFALYKRLGDSKLAKWLGVTGGFNVYDPAWVPAPK